MNRPLRRGAGETSSSSVHSITMCMKSEYDKWISGELVWDRWNDELVSITNEVKESMDTDEKRYLTFEQFNDWDYMEYETFEETYSTPNGETVKAFGYYGHD